VKRREGILASRAARRGPAATIHWGKPLDSPDMAEPDGLSDHVRAILAGLGEDPTREGLDKTPERVEKALRFLTRGYSQDAGKLINDALFTVDYDEMVTIKDIDVFSMCEHHLLPFFGRAHVAYIPDGKVMGLSKVPRVVDMFARRLQVQERLTVQIADTIMEKVKPKGVAVVIEAMHFCMIMRGVEKQNSVAVTSCMRGVFHDQAQTREEFLSLIKKKYAGLGG
jgi:GTP cyclohydrolase IA